MVQEIKEEKEEKERGSEKGKVGDEEVGGRSERKNRRIVTKQKCS